MRPSQVLMQHSIAVYRCLYQATVNRSSTAYRNSCASLAQGVAQVTGRDIGADTGTGITK
jgi:hypothetical protein